MFQCKDESKYIEENLFCDGHVHCPDASDEDPNECGNCQRTFGYPADRKKYATFRCRHRYTNRSICAVPCDARDDLCMNETDEDCSHGSEGDKFVFGLVLLVISVVCGELAFVYAAKAQSNNMEEELDLDQIMPNCLLGCFQFSTKRQAEKEETEKDRTDKEQTDKDRRDKEKTDKEKTDKEQTEKDRTEKDEIFFSFRKFHNSSNYMSECKSFSHHLILMNKVKGGQIAKHFFECELKYHKGNREAAHICMKHFFGTNANTKYIFQLIDQSESDSKFIEKLFNFASYKFASKLIFLLQVSLKIILYYIDMYKDFSILAIYIDYFPLFESKFESFGVQIFIILCISVTLPLLINLVCIIKSSFWQSSGLKPRLLMIALSPLVPAIAIYSTSKLNFLCDRLKTESREKQDEQEMVEASRTAAQIIKHEKLSDQWAGLLANLKSNENATEQFIQTLLLFIIIFLKFTSSKTVAGLQELLAKGSANLLVVSALWSLISIILGHVWKMSADKKRFLPPIGISLQFAFAVLCSVCRLSSILFFFAPPMGLFYLHRNWSGTRLNYSFIAFLIVIPCHFALVAIIKILYAREFKLRENTFDKLIHILHQGK